MLWQRNDLALDTNPARRFLPWLLAMIVFLAGLALAGMMGLTSAVDRWDKSLTGTVTIQLPPVIGKSDQAIKNVHAILAKTPGILSTRVIKTSEARAMLEPWLGKGAFAKDLPLPRLIDVRIRTNAPPNMEGLSIVLGNAVPGTVVDDHRKSLERIISLARSVKLIALIIVVLVTLSAISMVIFITRTGLAIHYPGIELLHLIGAVDNYIARQFQSQAMELGLKGGLIGFILTAATVIALTQFANAFGGDFLPTIALNLDQWLVLIMVPLGITLVGVITARFTVLAELRKMP
ncbi:MAG: cell division protein FtsX [Alphaproteobacteria bacterium]|jgi:cell division transport system permease protein